MTDCAIVNIYNMSAAMHFDHTEENNLLAYDEWLNITKVMFEISEFKKKMFYSLDTRNTKNQSYFSQNVSKKAIITISFFMKNNKKFGI